MNSGVSGQQVADVLFWASTGFLILGVILTALFTILWIAARSRPVAPSPPGYPPASRGGGCLLALAIVSFLFLVLGPVIGMTMSSFVDDLVPARRTYSSPANSGSNNPPRSTASSDASAAIDEVPRQADDAALTARLTAVAATMRSNLPQRNGPMTLDDARVEGNQLVILATLRQDFGATDWRAFDQGVLGAPCSTEFAGIIGNGGRLTYRVRDSGGETHEVSVTSCR